MGALNKPITTTASAAPAASLGEHLLERIGNTPLLRLERIGREFPHAEFLA